MALDAEEMQLLRISKASQRLLTSFRDGVYITTTTSRTLDDLRDQACADRLDLAVAFASVGDRLMRARPREYRSAVSRYYYSMYHSIRATVFYANDGDDHQKHDVLPKHTPLDFPDNALWENRLKDARGHRNDADYDPYPINPQSFTQPARDLRDYAHALTPLVRAYLRSKGCGHI